MRLQNMRLIVTKMGILDAASSVKDLTTIEFFLSLLLRVLYTPALIPSGFHGTYGKSEQVLF